MGDRGDSLRFRNPVPGAGFPFFIFNSQHSTLNTAHRTKKLPAAAGSFLLFVEVLSDPAPVSGILQIDGGAQDVACILGLHTAVHIDVRREELR